MDKVVRGFLALAFFLMGSAPAAAQVADHLACYKVKDSQAKTSYTATVGGLTVQAGC